MLLELVRRDCVRCPARSRSFCVESGPSQVSHNVRGVSGLRLHDDMLYEILVGLILGMTERACIISWISSWCDAGMLCPQMCMGCGLSCFLIFTCVLPYQYWLGIWCIVLAFISMICMNGDVFSL